MAEHAHAENRTLFDRVRHELGLTGSVPAPRHPVPLPARTDVAAMAWAAVAVASLAAAELAEAETIPLDVDRIAVAYTSERHLRIEGRAPDVWAPLSGFWRTSDGWVRTHGNYPHHAAALRRGLGVAPDDDCDVVARALQGMPAGVAVQAVTAAGGLCVAVRHEDPGVDRELRDRPLVEITRLGDAPVAETRDASPAAPLRGIRVLDLTRVIAGPVTTRTLALLGADVLRVDSPRLPEITEQHLDTGHGKRSTLLDLTTGDGGTRFGTLLETADVVVLGYRPSGLERLGLSPALLAARRPGLVVARLSAWGDPERRGFDSLVQAGEGLAWLESIDGERPGALPAQALDHSAGYLLAAGILTSLARRGREGGSWLVETSLRRVAAELLGMPRTSVPEPEVSVADPSAHLQAFDVAGVEVTTAAPAVAYSGAPARFAPPRAWGADPPEWRG